MMQKWLLFIFLIGVASVGSLSTPSKPLQATLTHSPDVIVVGSGIGGLCAANILSRVYKKRVLVLESHYIPGGCAHTFPWKGGYEFESGPTIMLGCSRPPLNPPRQVLDACGLNLEWIPYRSWGVLGDGDEQWNLEVRRSEFAKRQATQARSRQF